MTEYNEENNENKQSILDAAARLFASKGYDGVSVREIAENAGVTKPVIYYYFKNKEDLHQTLTKQAFTYTKELHERIYQGKEPIEEKLRILMRSHFQFCIDNPDTVKILYDAIHHQISNNEFIPPTEMSKKNYHDFRRISDFISIGQDQNVFREEIDPVKIGMIFIGAINMFVISQLHSETQVISDKIADELVDILLHGINSPTKSEETVESSQEDTST